MDSEGEEVALLCLLICDAGKKNGEEKAQILG